MEPEVDDKAYTEVSMRGVGRQMGEYYKGLRDSGMGHDEALYLTNEYQKTSIWANSSSLSATVESTDEED